jgi:hypothetical protein
MSEVDAKSRAVASAIGEFLKVAGEQTKTLSDYSLMLVVSADACRGVFHAEVWSKVVEKPSEVEVEAEAEAGVKKPASKPEEVKESLEVERLKSQVPEEKKVQAYVYLA